MNKKEIREIKKLFDVQDGNIYRIAGCYVSAEKEKRLTFTHPFLFIQEEESYKYVDILQKTLTGKKNLTDLHITRLNPVVKKVYDTELDNEEANNALYDAVIASFIPDGNYLILLSYVMCDAPAKASDGAVLEDSEYICRFLTMTICPVELSKAGLCCEAKDVRAATRNWMVKAPSESFLYPAFNERYEDHDYVLYYAKKDISEEMVKELLGAEGVKTAQEQKTEFNEILERCLGDECTMPVVKDMADLINRSEDESFTSADIAYILKESGASDRAVEQIKGEIGTDEIKKDIIAENKLTIKTNDMTIKASNESGLYRKRIDGMECLVIPLHGNVTVNDVQIKAET